VIGAVPAGHEPRVGELVESSLIEADRKGFHGRRGGAGHGGHDRAGVQAAAENAPDGHVADHVELHGFVEKVAEALDPLALRHRDVGRHVEAPVATDLGLTGVERIHETRRRRELPDVAEDRARRGDVRVDEVVPHRLPVELTLDLVVLEDRLDLGGEDQPPPVAGVDERLDAEPVAREQDTPPAAVPDREGEHAAQAGQDVESPGLVPMQDDLRVRGRPEGETASRELGRQLPIVVDLAVEGDPDRPVLRRHRLRAGREVDDREPPMPEADRALVVQTFSVGTAVGEDGRHSTQDVDVHRRLVSAGDAGDAAHG